MTETRTDRKNRTDAQNRYLWAVPNAIICKAMIEAGMRTESGKRPTPEYVHEELAKNFLPPRIGAFGLKVRGSTSTLTTQEFQDYIMAIQAHFAERQIDIPDPREEEMACYGKKIINKGIMQ